MASGDLVANVRPFDFQPDSGKASAERIKQVGNYFGYSLGKSDGFTFLAQVPINGTPLSTGLTVSVGIVDDPSYPNPSGVIELGVTIKPVATTVGTLTDPAATEVLASCTLNATSGIVTITPVAIPNASMNSLAAGNLFECHVRRVGTNSADTHTGRPVCFGVVVKDT